jgi:hypothetical protein
MRNIDGNANANTVEGIIGKSTYSMIGGFSRFVISICEKFLQYKLAMKIATWLLAKIINGKELDSRSATITENDISRSIGHLKNK